METVNLNKKCIKDIQDTLVSSTKENPAFYTILSGITAAVGLATNSPATVIGSMLLSPIGDIIVRLSIIGKFEEFGYNYPRMAFQEAYLEDLGIPVKKLIVGNDSKNDSIFVKLKNDENIEIKTLISYQDRWYFCTEDGIVYDKYAKKQKKFFFEGDYNKIYSGDIDVSFGEGKGWPVSVEKLNQEIKNYENINVNPLDKTSSIGKKYNWWHIFGWGISVCVIAVFIGFLCGIIFLAIQDNTSEPNFLIPTKEMEERSKIENAVGMIFIAGCAGIILPDAIRNKNTIRIVGISIATALLPPLVNMGLYLSVALAKYSNMNTKNLIKHTDINNNRNIDISYDDIGYAVLTSIVIFFINFILLYGITKIRLGSICKGRKGVFENTFL